MHTATSGEEALSILNDLKPDLVIMDVRMPKMDGLEVLEKIKESHPQIQVIMMTAYSTTEKAIQAIKLGAYDYLTKPFDNDELLIVYLAIILGPVIELPMLLLIPRVMLGIKDHIWVGILNEDCMRRSNDDN